MAPCAPAAGSEYFRGNGKALARRPGARRAGRAGLSRRTRGIRPFAGQRPSAGITHDAEKTRGISDRRQAWHGAMFADGAFRPPGRPAAPSRCATRPPARSSRRPGWPPRRTWTPRSTAARAAQPGWAGRTYAERAGLLRDVAAALASGPAPMRELIMRETGCIGGKADYEIGAAASELTEAAGAGLPGHRRGAADRPRGPVLAVRAAAARAGRRHHPVELPARAGHAGHRAGDRARQRRADEAVAGDARSAAAWPSPSCSRRRAPRRGCSRCCPATSRSASGWSPTPTSR